MVIAVLRPPVIWKPALHQSRPPVERASCQTDPYVLRNTLIPPESPLTQEVPDDPAEGKSVLLNAFLVSPRRGCPRTDSNLPTSTFETVRSNCINPFSASF